ncbi:hypothetical protein ETA12_09855 [Bacillus velezensis]|uniref:Uncharacterized protein n=1 Tax=Bacillus velezensis TaxID=492670 RepID=A0A411A6H1_BACVE|nr:hypothetical protein BK055_10000 [Bacillus velezensis]ASB53253.1 hypothetical protein S100072_01917 [Bacillus velezensis]ATY28394.1 hypothetical protein CVD07_08895 [Bacillus velezensis]AXS60871.1 hypothetical protein CK238_09400 [Bacillus velezensis]PAB05906.1 hypothetical protein BHU79_02015 [Bacillus velezensis]
MGRSCVKERIRMNVTSIHPDQWGSQCSISLYSNRNNITRVKKKKAECSRLLLLLERETESEMFV